MESVLRFLGQYFEDRKCDFTECQDHIYEHKLLVMGPFSKRCRGLEYDSRMVESFELTGLWPRQCFGNIYIYIFSADELHG